MQKIGEMSPALIGWRNSSSVGFSLGLTNDFVLFVTSRRDKIWEVAKKNPLQIVVKSRYLVNLRFLPENRSGHPLTNWTDGLSK